MSDVLCELDSLITTQLACNSPITTTVTLASGVTMQVALDSIIELERHEGIAPVGAYAPKFVIWR